MQDAIAVDLQAQQPAALLGRFVEAVEDEVAKAVDDQLAAVVFGALRDVRVVADDHAAYLAGQFEGEIDDEAGPPSVQLERFDVALASASQRLRRDHETAQQTLVQQRELLGRTLANFLERWPNPNLLADPDTSVGDFERILSEPHASLTEQYRELLKTEGLGIEFQADGIKRLAEIAWQVNEKTENIGARRLHTLLERLLEEVSFSAGDLAGQQNGEPIRIDAAYVNGHLGELAQDEDLSRYIL